MNFDTKDMEVKTLFRTYESFKIPVFQRDYSWDKPFYSKFMDDIISKIKVEDQKIITTPYFIGTMVFVGERNGGEVAVVDGQQRITVITIILSVISEIFKQKNEEELSSATFKYIKEVDDDGKPKSRLLSDTSYPYFECFIQSREKKYIDKPKSEEEDNIKLTYDYFLDRFEEKKIRKELPSMGKCSYIEILKGIRDQMLSSMTISIRTPDRESAYMIYEILNAKGKSLASIDLIKNVIFEVMHDDPNGATERAEILWEEIKNILRERDNSIGFATYYRHYWISKYAKSTNVKLYDSFKSRIKPKTIDIAMQFLIDLNKEAREYIKIISPELSDYDNRKEYAWLVQSLKAINSTFGTVQARIALLALFDVKNRDLISNKKFKETILYLENFILSYIAIGSQRANVFENIFSSFAISLRKTKLKSETNTIIQKFLIEKLEAKYIKYETFEENFIQLEFKKGNDPNNITTKYVVNKISAYVDKREIFHDDSSIEHIIPESSEKSINIGNLICLEEVLNGEADDLPYDEKLEVYSKSKYDQVKEFIESNVEWSEEKIDERSKELATFYYTKILGRDL